ncbi:DUF1592 domain-containing protein [Sandaracinus amylolyticus]|uniref:DUF1592 domain-containing protein n=1 Tax=Sandaracinus amylolyticus TaxID=927083 RepID=UPI001F46C1E1|nr:DUF1592 domain-containing protein [Sandaracinus amylolyticus]UJR82329.1 Hypothetical protein I5071_43940 [Sandaracinus amylolyticus]
MRRDLLAITISALVSSACVGALEDPAARPSGTAPPGGPGPIPEALCEREIQPGSSPFRRLTRDEYDATVLALLGDESAPARAFPPDEDGLGFAVGATVSPLLAENYLRAAETLAASAIGRGLGDLLPCDLANGDEACARAFVTSFGRRAYRRALDDAQIDRVMEVHRAGSDFESGIRLVITAMLTSPYFLYRVELGPPDLAAGERVIPLTMDERATRLSYFLWGTMPDDALFAAADAGELETVDQIADHARRMLDDPRALRTIERFVDAWLELELDVVSKDPETYPDWSDELAAAMHDETRAFVDHVLTEGSGTLDELLTADYSFVSPALAAVYGVEVPEGATEPVRVALDPTQRAGLLTQPGFLSQHARGNQSSPVFRGRFVRERLLCQTLPPPPEDLLVVPPEPDPSASTRDRFEQHRSDPACSGCHELMDPIGFGFEHYDAIGRWRDRDEGFDVDASGRIVGTRETDGEFEGAVDLAHRLANSPDVHACLTQQWWEFAFRRTVEEADACSIDEVRRAFDESGRDLRALIIALVRTDAFLYRRAAEGEVSP